MNVGRIQKSEELSEAMEKITPAELRKQLGVSQGKMAEICNTAIGTVRKWESLEQSPSGPSLRLLHILVWLKSRGLLDKCIRDIEINN